MAGTERCAKATIWRYVMAVLSGMHGACIVRVCVVPFAGGFLVPCCVRGRSSASYFTYLCVDKVLVVVDDIYESSLGKLCKCLHQGLEEVWREANFGYGNWGGRLPRGDLWCGIGESSLQRARGYCPTNSRAVSTAPSACYALRVFYGCCIYLSFFLSFFLKEGGVVDPRGGVGLGVVDFSFGRASLNLGSCGG